MKNTKKLMISGIPISRSRIPKINLCREFGNTNSEPIDVPGSWLAKMPEK
jgi:hypothetical protein